MSGNLLRIISDFFVKKGKWLLLLFLFLLIGYCYYVWYIFIYHNQWSDEKKMEYIKSQEKEVVFNKTQFDRIVAEREERAARYNEEVGDKTDIFRIKK